MSLRIGREPAFRNFPAGTIARGFAFVLVLLSSFGGVGQSLNFLNRQSWSTEEGLPQASVHQVFQARDGYIWLATEGGAARFDGISFTVFTRENSPAFKSDDISAMAQDRSGALWFGTADGLVRRDARGLRRFSESDGLPSSVILSLAAPGDGSLLVLTSGGLVRYDQGRFRKVEGVQTPDALQQEVDGSVLLFTGTGIDRFQSGAVSANAVPAVGSAPLLGAQHGPEGPLWEWSRREVIALGGGHPRAWRTGIELQGSRVQSVAVDRRGIAWTGTNRGLFTIDLASDGDANAVSGFQGDSILSVFEDREGNHWIGTEGDGVHVLRPRKFYAEPASAFEAVTTVVRGSDGAIWYGTRDSGLRRIVNGKAETPVAADALTSPVILSLAPGNHGDLWAGTPDGLNHVDRGKVQRWTSAEGMPDEFVRSIAVEKDGSVWAGTRRGLAHINTDGKLTVLGRGDGLGSDSIGVLALAGTPRGHERFTGPDMWIGTASGLSHLEGNRIRNYSYQDGRATGAATALAEDDNGLVFIGLHGAGLNVLAAGAVQHVASADLPSEIEAMQADATGHLWLRARRGVYRVDTKAVERCVGQDRHCSLQVQQFGTANGLPSDEMVAAGQPSIAVVSDREMLFATRKGIAVTDPERLAIDTVPPAAVIERFLVDGVAGASGADMLSVDYGHHRYTFDYAGLAYTLPSQTRYRYKLQGYDRDWVDAGTRRSAYYTGLAPGTYRFLVLAQNADGVWSRQPAELAFRVIPPLYRRWWAYCLEIVAAALLILLVFRLRLGRERRQFALVLNERNRVAREIHDTLAQDLVSVSLHLELASSLVKANRREEAVAQLQETRGFVKQGLESARQSIWSLRANTAQNSLPTRLTTSVERFRKNHPNTHLKIGGAYRALPGEVEDQLIRVADESLSNIDRHANATEVWVELAYERDRLLLTVRDDGKGFRLEEAHELTGHYGLRGMQERAAHLGGRITITSNPGEGTSVALSLPLALVKA